MGSQLTDHNFRKSLMPMTHAPETGDRSRPHAPENWRRFLKRVSLALLASRFFLGGERL